MLGNFPINSRSASFFNFYYIHRRTKTKHEKKIIDLTQNLESNFLAERDEKNLKLENATMMYECNILQVLVPVFCGSGVGEASGNSFLLWENIFNCNEEISYNFLLYAYCLMQDEAKLVLAIIQ